MELQKKHYRISSCNGKLPSSSQFPQTSNFPTTTFSDRQQTHDPARSSSYQAPNFPRTVFSDRQQTHDPAHSKPPDAQLSQDSFVRPTTNTRPSTQQLPTPQPSQDSFLRLTTNAAAVKCPAFPGLVGATSMWSRGANILGQRSYLSFIRGCMTSLCGQFQTEPIV